MEFYAGGYLLKHIRKILGITQRELGMGKINHNIISRIENGMEPITLIQAMRLCDNINRIALSKERNIKITVAELLEPIDVKFNKWCEKELEVVKCMEENDEKIQKYYKILDIAKKYEKKNLTIQIQQIIADELYKQSRFDEAFTHYSDIIPYYETNNDNLKLVEINLFMGKCFYPRNLDEGFQYFYKAYKLLETLGVNSQSSRLKAEIIFYISAYHARKENFICAQEYLDYVNYSKIEDEELIIKMLILQANIFLRRGYHSKAVEVLEKLLKKNDEMISPYKYMIYNNLGICFNNLGEYDKSIESLNNAIKLQLNRNLPEFSNSLIHIGKVYFKLKKYDISVRFIEAALGNAEKHNQSKYVIESYELLYSLYRKMKNKNQCSLIIERMEQAIVDSNFDNDFSQKYNIIKVDYLLLNEDLKGAKAFLDNIFERKDLE